MNTDRGKRYANLETLCTWQNPTSQNWLEGCPNNWSDSPHFRLETQPTWTSPYKYYTTCCIFNNSFPKSFRFVHCSCLLCFLCCFSCISLITLLEQRPSSIHAFPWKRLFQDETARKLRYVSLINLSRVDLVSYYNATGL